MQSERNYADWYQQNAGQIEGLYRSFDSTVNVTFQTAVDYIKNLSQQKKVAVETHPLAAFQVLRTGRRLRNPFQ